MYPNMSNPFAYLPNIDPAEMSMLQSLTAGMDATRLQTFTGTYATRRKDPNTILLTDLMGFLGIAGIHRFILENIGMGVLYLLTGGLCGIGTIIDAINYRNLTLEYNTKMAHQTIMMLGYAQPQNPVPPPPQPLAQQ
jgi:TM2 domain-containing membrane protein YozV